VRKQLKHGLEKLSPRLGGAGSLFEGLIFIHIYVKSDEQHVRIFISNGSERAKYE